MHNKPFKWISGMALVQIEVSASPSLQLLPMHPLAGLMHAQEHDGSRSSVVYVGNTAKYFTLRCAVWHLLHSQRLKCAACRLLHGVG